jgi:chromosome segregation ATPase
VRELRGKQEDVQAKLDRNCDRLKQQEATVAKLKAALAKAEAAHDELVTIIENQQQKVRELHTLLGSISDSDSEGDCEDEGMDPEDEEDEAKGRPGDAPGWRTVGRRGRITKSLDEDRLACLMGMRTGTATQALRGEGRWGDGSDGEAKARHNGVRSRSPPK